MGAACCGESRQKLRVAKDATNDRPGPLRCEVWLQTGAGPHLSLNTGKTCSMRYGGEDPLFPGGQWPAAMLLPKWVAGQYMKEVGVLVAQLRRCPQANAKYGVLHFAGLAARFQQLCLPIVKRRGAVHISNEWDRLTVAFEDVVECGKAAMELPHAVFLHNNSLDESQLARDFTISLKAVAVNSGPGLLVDYEDNLFGEVFRGASQLIEDCPLDGSVCIPASLMPRLKGQPFFKEASFLEFKAAVERSPICIIGGDLSHFGDECPSCESADHVGAKLVPLCKRQIAGPNLQRLDAEIKAQHLQIVTVLMFNLDIDIGCHQPAASALLDAVSAKKSAITCLDNQLSQLGGKRLEDVLWCFSNPVDAVNAAVVARDVAAAWDDPVEVSGWGIHTGELLVIEGTGLHWGDSVAKATQLGQDQADMGEILVTHAVKKAIDGLSSTVAIKFKPFLPYSPSLKVPCFEVEF